jgi:hypothetical protein
MPGLNDKTKEPQLEAAVDALVQSWPDVAIGKMFGSRSYRAKGVLFAMIGGEGLILTKLDPQQRAAVVDAHEAHPFVGRGKEVPAWAEFAVADAAGLDRLATLVRNAYDGALSEAR